MDNEPKIEVPILVKPKPLKRKLHLNWDENLKKYLVKKSFNYTPPVTQFTQAEIDAYLIANPTVEIVARYI